MIKPKIQVRFVLTGNFDPTEVTKILHVQPTKTWKVGQIIQNTAATYKHDGWSIISEEVESLDLSEPLLDILHAVYPYKDILTDLYSSLELKAEIACSIELEGEQHPSINMSNDIIQQISELRAGLDIDIY